MLICSIERHEDMNKKLYYALMALFSLIVTGCAVYLGVYYISNFMADKNQQELADYIEENAEGNTEYNEDEGTPHIQKKYEKIYGLNPDFAGWIQIPDTKIDYAVMLNKEENEYYLRRDFHKKDSMAGMLFIDNQCDIMTPGTNIIIYGHNMKAGTMFHDLFRYEEESFYQTHKYITFNSVYRDGTYEVIGAFYTQIEREDSDNYRYYRFFEAESAEEYDAFVSYVKSETPYLTADAAFGDGLLTLSTCSYHTENGRFVVVAKRIAEDRDSEKEAAGS